MERNYATQMDAARRGIVTPELKKVAEKEYMAVEDLMPLVASGKVAIPANKLHTSIDPEGIGSMLRTKINVNLGVSKDCKDYDVEMQKVLSAVNMGAEAIMDLSSHGNTQPFRRKLTSECPAMIGTVPVYDSVIHYQRDLDTLTAKDFIDVIRLHAEDGVDFVTLHCGITRKTIDQIRKHKRKMNIVSRGGSLVFAWMCMTGEENPFYEYYDEILDICREYDVTISLGDACRPGCLADATDVCQIEELVRLGELTKRAWEKDVQVMVEGPGHVPMDQIAANMKVQQTICMGAPFYVLGPLVTDIAPGYDHITAAIGGAIAAMNGAAFLCYVTPAEHLALPNLDDVKQGIIASKIAAHAADIAKGVPHARDIDDKMGDARRVLDWEAQWDCALDPETAKAIRADRSPEQEDTCSMCGTKHEQSFKRRTYRHSLTSVDKKSQYAKRNGFHYETVPFLHFQNLFLFRPSFGVTDCFVPSVHLLIALLFRELRLKCTVNGSVLFYRLLIRPVADGESRKISCSHRGRLDAAWPLHRRLADVRLALHQEVVGACSAVHTQRRELHTGICLHGF